jgi:hypothetical protein
MPCFTQSSSAGFCRTWEKSARLCTLPIKFSSEEIMKNRDFATSTVLGHINKLVEENLIGNVQRRALFSQVRQNPALYKQAC